MPTYPENMNLTTAAKYLGVSSITVRRMLKDREIPAAKIRGRWLFKKNVIDEWLAKNSWSQITKTVKKRWQAPPSSSQKIHPSVAHILSTLNELDFEGLDPVEWDEAKKWLKEQEAKRTQRLVELAEQGE
jgi:excisionase family DNA binding protein